MSARPSDVSLGERSRRLLILGSTRFGWDGTMLPCVSIMGCPLKELDTSALSASPRRLTEGVLEVEGPTSADAGVASCLLVNAKPVFWRLRDDLSAWHRVAASKCKNAPWKVLLDQRETSRRNKGNRETSRAAGNWRWASGKEFWKVVRRTVVALETKHWRKLYATKSFAKWPPNVSTLIYIL